MAFKNIELNHQKILELIDENAEVEQILTGCEFTEGPIWSPKEKCLYFSDMPGDKRRRWSEADGVSIVKDPSNKCNGMTYDADGNLYVCEHVTSTLVKETPDGERVTIASHWDGKELNSPNDVVLRNDGVIYFSDPWYGRMPVFGEERERELGFQGLYRITADGELHLEADDFEQTNGLCFSPDEKLLYVNDSPRGHIRVFDVSADGSLSNSRMFADDIGDGELDSGIVDGMKTDEKGNIYVTGPRGMWVFDAEGHHLGIIKMPEHAGNLNWGGDNWDVLYCCCATSVYRVQLKVRGNHSSYMDMK